MKLLTWLPLVLLVPLTACENSGVSYMIDGDKDHSISLLREQNLPWGEVEQQLGISHARMVNAAQGKPLGTEIFLTLCHWMQQDPMHFCDAASPARALEGAGR